jgi:hypothetical protein
MSGIEEILTTQYRYTKQYISTYSIQKSTKDTNLNWNKYQSRNVAERGRVNQRELPSSSINKRYKLTDCTVLGIQEVHHLKIESNTM